ncbi:MAG: hypothetical protein V1900_00290 [Candidatus Aenigmatarchaeota archaeon]
MGRKKGFDDRKISSIVRALRANPDGIWLRRLSEELGMAPATVAKYVEGILKPLVDDSSLGNGKPIIRVIKLKPFVLERLQEGKDITEIMKLLRVLNKI